MKQISQPCEVNFSAVEFNDALIMLPVMDNLVNNLNSMVDSANKNTARYNKSVQDGKPDNWYKNNANVSIEEAKSIHRQLDVLFKLGFITSPDVVIAEIPAVIADVEG